MMLSMRSDDLRAAALRVPPSTRAVLLRYALGTASATVVIVVGGYFVLRSVAIDEAKLDTRTKVFEAGQLVESALDGRSPVGRPSLSSRDRRCRPRSGIEQLGRAGQDLVTRRPGALLRRPGSDRWSVRPRRQPARLLREGGAEVEVSALDRPENERDRGQGQADRGLHRDPNAVRESLSCSRSTSGSIPSPRVRAGCSGNWLRRSSARSRLLVLVQVPLVWSLIQGPPARERGTGDPPRECDRRLEP